VPEVKAEPATNGFPTHGPETSQRSPVTRPQSKVRGRRWWPRTKLGVIALIGVVACAILTSTVLYIDGEGAQRTPSVGGPTKSGTTVTFNVANIQNNYSELVGDLIVKPGPDLLDPATDGLKQDLTVAVTSTTTPARCFPRSPDGGARRRTLAVRYLLHRAGHG
jgi:hypothetical protein